MVVPFHKMPIALSLTLARGGFGLTMSTLVCFIVVVDLVFAVVRGLGLGPLCETNFLCVVVLNNTSGLTVTFVHNSNLFLKDGSLCH